MDRVPGTGLAGPTTTSGEPCPAASPGQPASSGKLTTCAAPPSGSLPVPVPRAQPFPMAAEWQMASPPSTRTTSGVKGWAVFRQHMHGQSNSGNVTNVTHS
jgi:hypothetical protein